MSIKKDKFIPEQSQVKALSDLAEMVRLDLSLNRNPYLNSGSVIGRVLDFHGMPIADAVVIILDISYTAIANTITDSTGFFAISQIESDYDYRIIAKAQGYLLSDISNFSLKANQTKELNITLIPDQHIESSIIAGEIHTSDNSSIISASIELYKVTETSTKLINISFPNQIGQFIISDINTGSYFIKVNAQGYLPEFLPILIDKPRTIFKIDVNLKKNIKAPHGIITGIVTDPDDQPISNADVILYRLGLNNSFAPIEFTRTNREGIYLFVNVPKGEYYVNSNRTIIVDK